jgi:hypothetical protein
MKEWVVVGSGVANWTTIAEEAYRFGQRSTKRVSHRQRAAKAR